MLAAVMLSDFRGRAHRASSRSRSVVLPQPRTGLVTISRGVTVKRWYTKVCAIQSDTATNSECAPAMETAVLQRALPGADAAARKVPSQRLHRAKLKVA